VLIKASKGGIKKTIPMSNTLYEMLLRRSKVTHISGKVFPVNRYTLKDAFKRTVEKAGIEDLHFHDLRHTFATRLIQNGVSLYIVQKLLGHKTIKMTERYAHHSPDRLRSSLCVLDDCYSPRI
jgi:integrase